MADTPTIYTDDAMALVRHGLTLVGGILVTRGALTAGQSDQFVSLGIGLAMFIVSVTMSLWQKHQAKLLLLTALAAPVGATECDVKSHIAAGLPVPPVTTPPNIVPVAPTDPSVLKAIDAEMSRLKASEDTELRAQATKNVTAAATPANPTPGVK